MQNMVDDMDMIINNSICDCIDKLNSSNNLLLQDLKNSICLLKNYIHTLKLHALIGLCNYHHFVPPMYLINIVKQLVYTKKNKCRCESCGCHNLISLGKKIDCETYNVYQNNASTKCSEPIGSIKAVYCDPCTNTVCMLTKKDICAKPKKITSKHFTQSVQVVIAKYDGFIIFFKKILDYLLISKK